MYRLGQGIDKDYSQAIYWYQHLGALWFSCGGEGPGDGWQVISKLSDVLMADPARPSAAQNRSAEPWTCGDGRAMGKRRVSRAFNSLGAMYAAGWGTEKSKTLGRSCSAGWEVGVGITESFLAEVPRRSLREKR
eukprot:Skav215970  [mRNA]  locus=scaffold3174:28017:29684:+ [translate_table: standard]